tara:strand:+ start:526 stop:852 length:327 start_codon:yes stop_codon:yes gene_type:complete
MTINITSDITQGSYSVADPMLSEMIKTLYDYLQYPDVREEARLDIALAVYHFAAAYYEGRRSNLYQALSHMSKVFLSGVQDSPELEGGLVPVLYEHLVDTYVQEASYE